MSAGAGGSYARFEDNLHKLGELAQHLLERLGGRESVLRILERRYPTEERYWSVKKLYSLAMFIPVFLQIGMKHFDRLVYVDTHSGPGLAKLGPEEDEVVPGSPLIALFWPRIVASECPPFRKISRGFDRFIFVERGHDSYITLRKLTKISEEVLEIPEGAVTVIEGDSNRVLPTLWRKLEDKERENRGRGTLALLFVDPYGSLDTQLEFAALESFLTGRYKVDIVMNVMSSSLARGLSRILSDRQRYREEIRRLFGELCDDSPGRESLELCRASIETARPQGISVIAVLRAYEALLERFGYSTHYSLRVEFRGEQALYHILLASRSPGAGRWLANYVAYLEENLPRSYEELKSIWFSVFRRGEGIDKWL